MSVSADGRSSNSNKAVIVIVATVFSLALGDALIKGSSSTFTLWQIFCLRSMVVVPVLVLLLRMRFQKINLVPNEWKWTLLRSFLLTLMWISYYAALPHISLAVAAASYYTLPIFITLFAAVFLKETISIVGWLGIALGFCGILLVLQPRASDFNIYAALPLVSAVLYALAMILTRSKCRVESVLILSLWLNMMMLCVGLLVSSVLWLAVSSESYPDQMFLLGNWTSVGAREWAVICFLSITILIGSTGAAYAYQNGRPATIATFDFAYVAFSVLFGILIFNEFPNTIASVGIVLIVAAGFLSIKGASE